MAKANVDPADLRRFARDLVHFREEVQTLMSGLQGKLRNLETTWRDEQQQRFSEEFQRTLAQLRRFLEASEQHIGLLRQRAGHIEEYLKQR